MRGKEAVFKLKFWFEKGADNSSSVNNFSSFQAKKEMLIFGIGDQRAKTTKMLGFQIPQFQLTHKLKKRNKVKKNKKKTKSEKNGKLRREYADRAEKKVRVCGWGRI